MTTPPTVPTPPTPSVQPPIPHVEVVDRKWSDVDLLHVDETSLDPTRHYRWVRSRADEYHTAVAKRKRHGYRIELKTGGVRTLVDTDDRGDGAIAIGDLILMSCSKAVHERRVNEHFRKSESLLESATAETEQMAKEKGISLIKDADHARTSHN